MKKLLLTLTAALTCTSAIFASFPEEGKWYQLKNSLYPQSVGAAADIRDNSYLGYYPQSATDNVQWTIILESGGTAKAMGNNQYLCGAENAFGDSSTATEAQKARQAWKFVYDEDHEGYYLVNKAFPDGAISGVVNGNKTNSSRWQYEADRNAAGANICYFIITNSGTEDNPQCRLEIKNPESGVGKYMNIAASPQSYQLMRNDAQDGGSLWIVNVISEYLTADEQNALLSGKINGIKENAKNFIDLGIAPQTAITAWDNAVTAAGNTLSEEVISSLHTAYNKLVSAANTGYVKIRHAGTHSTHYVTVNENGVCVHSDATGKQALRLEPAAQGFYLKNEYTNRYFKLNPTHDTTCLMVETTQEASAFEFLLNEDDITVSVHEIDGDASRYFHANQGTTVMPWNRGSNSNLNSCWYLEFVGADQAASEHLAGALALNPQVSNTGKVGYLKADAEYAEARNAAETITSTAAAAQKNTAADNLWAATISANDIVMPTTGKIYTITNSAGRGQLVYAAGKDAVWSTGRTLEAGTETNNQWTLINNDGELLLYNLGAKKFANAFGPIVRENSANAASCNFAWQFSEVGTPVTVDLGSFTMPTDGTAHAMRILGGESTVANRPGGMMVIDVLLTPVPTVAGFSDNDGEGFIFVEVGDFTQDDATAAQEAIEAGDEAYTTLKEEVEAVKTEVGEYNEEVHGVTVGHFTAEAWAAFTAALGTGNAAVGDAHSHDYNEYHYALALAAANATSARNGLEDNEVYTLTDSEGNYHHAIGGKQGSHKEKDSTREDFYNWACVLNVDGTVSFTHTHDEVTVKFNHGGDKFNISYPALGKVALEPAAVATVATESEAEAEAPALTFTIMKTDGSSTTAIDELSTINHQQSTVYDLQGRKLVAPVKGINIINGQKILVK